VSTFTLLACCLATGLVTALFLVLFARYGLFPLVLFTETEPPKEEKE
jgi:hypothetical protein